MTRHMRGGWRVAGILMLMLAVVSVMTAGCVEQYVGCDDACGCVLLAEYFDSNSEFFVNVSDECGPIVTLGPFPTSEQAEEAFELF
jgi:hypothetical protein